MCLFLKIFHFAGHKSPLASTILQKSVRFNIINIYLMIRNTFLVEIWPLSHMNDAEPQESGLNRVKNPKTFLGEPQTP